MAKALIINGLHRSGTTMLARLIDSQPGMTCFGNIFEMLKIIGPLRGIPDKNQIIRESFISGNNKITEKSYENLRSKLLSTFLDELAGISVHQHFFDDGSGKIYGFSMEQMFGITNVIANHQPINDIASLLAAVGDKLGVPVIGTKWTTGHNYAPEFLSSPDGYWLEIIRHPYATRASEEMRNTNTFWSNFKDHEDAFRFASTFRHQRFHVVRYEDLCTDTDNCLKEISDWLGEEVRNTELLNPLGGKFYPATSYHVLNGKSPESQDQTMAAVIGSLDMERWRKTFSHKQMAFVNIAIDFHGLYAKEPVPLPATVHAYLKLFKIKTFQAVRGLILGLLKSFGLTLTRTRKEMSL